MASPANVALEPENPSCVFCRIVGGEDALVVFDDRHCLAFLDKRPVFPGHTLIVPKRHFETLPDLPDDLMAPLFGAARLVSKAVVQGLEADGSFVGINNIVSQSVPHLHVHVIPRRRKDGLRGFFWPRQPYKDDSDAHQVQAAIAKSIGELRPKSSTE